MSRKTKAPIVILTPDITERKRAEEALKESEEKFRTFMETASDLMHMADKDGNITYVNESTARTLGYPKEEMIGKHVTQFLSKEVVEKDFKPKWEELITKGKMAIETTWVTKDRKEIYGEQKVVAVYDSDGTYAGSRATFRDLTERKRAEEEIQIQRARFESIFQNSLEGIVTLDKNNNILDANLAFENIYGYRLREIKGKRLDDVIVPKRFYYGEAKELDKMALDGILGYETIRKRKDGTEINVSLSAGPIEMGGEVRGRFVIFRDITERKRAEDTIKLAHAELDQIFNTATDAMRVVDKDFNVLRVNGTHAALAGVSNDEAVGKKCYELLRNSRCHTPHCPLTQILGGEERVQYEVEMERGDGTRIPCIATATPFRESRGRLIGIVEDFRDITERKEDEEALRESEQKYRALFENLNDAAFLADAETGRILDANKQGEVLLGRSREEITGLHQSELHPPGMANEYRQRFTRHVQKGRAADFDGEAIRKDGSIVPVNISAALVTIGEKQLILGLFRDITERKRMELGLREKNEQLDAQNEELQSQTEELMSQQQELVEKTREVERANRLKSEFLSGMSHELRTPLNVIIGFSELMVDEVPGKTNEEQRQCLNDILGSSRYLLNLINGVLDLSKIESGKEELKPENIALTGVVESLARAMMPVLAPRKQSLDVEIEAGLPLVYADEVKLEQVLLNLVDNASKFTPDGGKLKIEAVREGEWCRVSVVDDGLGIREEDQERIFEPFCQLDNPLVKERGGTGLGLALVRQIVEKYGGRIWVESEPGRGSRFNFTLPLATSG